MVGRIILFAALMLAPVLHGSERVAVFGDSITHQGYYVCYLQLITDLQWRDGPAFRNLGVSGDAAGRADGRFDWDLMSERPDRVLMMFGMNDVDRSAYVTRGDAVPEVEAVRRKKALRSFDQNIRALVGLCREKALPVSLITPSPYDQYSAKRDDERENPLCCNEPGLAECAEIVRRLARERGLSVAEVHAPMTALARKMPGRWLCGWDRVHPGAEGGLLMAVLVAESFGYLPTNTVICANAAGRRSLEVRMDAPMPFPDVPEAKFVDKVHPFLGRFNRMRLEISGLRPGRYGLALDDGTPVGTYSAAELHAGVEMGTSRASDRTRARQAYEKMNVLRKHENDLRKIAFVHHMGWVEQNGGKRDDANSSLAAIEKWMQKLEAEKKGAWQYYLEVSKTYRKIRADEREFRKQAEKLRGELRELARPQPLTVSIDGRE